ncbi:MAG: 4'-phosphopantetheinyl transferase superfamily protein [Methylococcaceae bacterium]|jgi:4'-phosphopantetheinyl transferase
MLPIEQVDVWHGALDAFDGPGYWGDLTEAEQHQAGQIKHPQIQQRFVQVRSHLRQVLASYLNLPPTQIAIAKAEYGKPYLADFPELAFNLSHTANDLVIAVGLHCQLGIDIEHYLPRANLAALVKKFFADEEAAYWQALPETEQTQAFYQFWTRKEALVKASGRGIAAGLKQCVLNPSCKTEFLSVPIALGVAKQWQLLEVDLGLPVCLALVSQSDVKQVVRQRIL